MKIQAAVLASIFPLLSFSNEIPALVFPAGVGVNIHFVTGHEKDLDRVYSADDLANGQNIIFCATGISDSALLQGVRARGGVTATTHSILMRAKSKTVRFIRARHDLQIKTIRLRSDNREHIL